MSTRMLVAVVVAVPLVGLAVVIAILVGSGGDDSRPVAAVSEVTGPAPAATTALPTPAVSPGGVSSADRIETDPRFSRVRRIIPKDAIPPIYEPAFVSARQSSLVDTDFVLGLAIDGDARAYSVALLNSREMVNDVVGGVPVLVTW